MSGITTTGSTVLSGLDTASPGLLIWRSMLHWLGAKYILFLYLGLTGAGALALWIAGMTAFEAFNHAMSLISTGGFSTSDASLGHWTQPAIHWIAVVIMILGSLPFTLYVATLRGNRRALLKDHQVRGFIGFLIVTWLAVGTWLCFHSDYGWWDAFRIVAVNVTSVVTTTGIAAQQLEALKFSASRLLVLY
ncbi:hypothetical protein L1887_49624 [Cichorium endivia]|nr:hypothetical protein L1887_49624 [Cichorium endivia]